MFPTARSAIGMTICAAASLLAAAAHAETMDDLYAKAKSEGSVVFYSGGPVAPYEGLARDFEQRFPGLIRAILNAHAIQSRPAHLPPAKHRAKRNSRR